MLRTIDMAQGNIDELLKVYMWSENVKVRFAQAKALELLALSCFGLQSELTSMSAIKLCEALLELALPAGILFPPNRVAMQRNR